MTTRMPVRARLRSIGIDIAAVLMATWVLIQLNRAVRLIVGDRYHQGRKTK
jgi:hypothetical protein